MEEKEIANQNKNVWHSTKEEYYQWWQGIQGNYILIINILLSADMFWSSTESTGSFQFEDLQKTMQYAAGAGSVFTQRTHV